MYDHQTIRLALAMGFLSLQAGCFHQSPKTAQEIVQRCLDQEGGENRWRDIRTIRKTSIKTIAVAENTPVQSVEVLEWDLASSRWRLESTSGETSRLTIGNATRSTIYKLKDGKIVGASDLQLPAPNLSESITLAMKIPELDLTNEPRSLFGKDWQVVSKTEGGTRWLFDANTSLLAKKLAASSYGDSETSFDDYRTVNGIQFAFRTQTKVKQASYTVEELVQSIELDIPFDESRFDFDDSWRRIKVGEMIPDFDFADVLQVGKRWTKESVQGRYVLLDFWATWCGPCIAEFPALKKTHERFQERGFQVLAISLDSDAQQHRDFAVSRLQAWGNAIVDGEFDSDVANRFEISSVPRAILIDPQGTILALDDDLRGERLDLLLEKVLGDPE